MKTLNFVNAENRLKVYKLMGIKPNFSVLSRELGLDRHTIKKMYEEREKKARKQRESVLDKHKNAIADLLKDPAISITAAYNYLTDCEECSNPISCTMSNFYKFVTKYNLNVKEKNYVAHLLYETDPGQQLQFDWVEELKLTSVNGELFNFNVFSATLGYSRMHYFEYSKNKTETDLKRCILHAFEYFGGTTKEALTDNMSAIVTIEDGKRNIHPTVVQFFKDLGVKLILAKVRTPQTKGKVETANKFVKWIYAYNNRFTVEVDLHNIIYNLSARVNQIVNTGTNRPPIVLFENEKGTLRKINKDLFNERNKQYLSSQIVPATCLLYYKKKLFGVNQKYIGKRVVIKGEDSLVNIYYNNILIASYTYEDAKKVNYNVNDYTEVLKNKGFSYDKIEEFAANNLAKLK